MEGLGDETVRDVGSVVPSGVDEVDAQSDDASEHRPCTIGILGLAPYVRTGQAHRAEAHARHFEITEVQSRREDHRGHGRSLASTREIGAGA